jgi:hypothetical protein
VKPLLSDEHFSVDGGAWIDRGINSLLEKPLAARRDL